MCARRLRTRLAEGAKAQAEPDAIAEVERETVPLPATDSEVVVVAEDSLMMVLFKVGAAEILLLDTFPIPLRNGDGIGAEAVYMIALAELELESPTVGRLRDTEDEAVTLGEDVVGMGSAVTVSVAKTVTVMNFAGSREVRFAVETLCVVAGIVEAARDEDAAWEVVDAGTFTAAAGGAVTPGGVDMVLRSSEVVCSFARGSIMIAVLSCASRAIEFTPSPEMLSSKAPAAGTDELEIMLMSMHEVYDSLVWMAPLLYNVGHSQTQ